MTEQRRWFAGVDWATAEHAVCVMDHDGKVLGERLFAHSGTGLAEMCAWLLERTGATPSEIFVAIEVPHGAVVETLLERGMIVHSINPKQVDRFRDRFTVAGSKDDRRDAHVIADSLRTDAACFRRLRADDATVIQLREWSRIADEITDERLRLGNRIREQLLRYFPQMLELADGEQLTSEAFMALWELIPKPEAATRVREQKLKKFLVERRVRRFDARHALTTLRQPPLIVAPGTVEAAMAHIASLVARLRPLNEQQKIAHRRLDELTNELGAKEAAPGQINEQRDVDILRSLPGVGRNVLATLLAEASRPLADRDYHALRSLSGVAPVTKNSGKRQGKRSIVVMRNACNVRLREALHHWARVAAQHDPKSRAAYRELRQRGHSHGRTLRTVGDRLLRLACAMLRDRTVFDITRRGTSAA